MRRQLTVDFGEALDGVRLQANDCDTLSGTPIRLGGQLVVGADAGVDLVEVGDYPSATGVLPLCLFGEQVTAVEPAPDAAAMTARGADHR